MTRHRRSFPDKIRDTIGYLIILFLFFPGVMLFLGVISGLTPALVDGLLTLYYLGAIFAVIVGGALWLERKLE